MFNKVRKIFSAIRQSINKVDSSNFDSFFDKIEDELLDSGILFDIAENLREKLREFIERKGKISEKEFREILKKEILGNISTEDPENFVKKINEIIKENKICKILFIGFNGSGKTTSLAKLAHFLKKKGFRVLITAADTFRAASIEQLEKWGKELDIPIFSEGYNVDPTAVAYDSINFAKEKGYNVVLIDTAGRSYENYNLMKEIEKMVKVIKPDFIIFVGDALSGHDLINQFDSFKESCGRIDYVIFSKSDLDKKGGSIISLLYYSKVPLLFLGTGEGKEDIMWMKKEDFEKILL